MDKDKLINTLIDYIEYLKEEIEDWKHVVNELSELNKKLNNK